MIRAFIAFDLTQDLREALRALQEELRKARADVRWVRPEGIHLTIKFLGNITEERVEKIAEAMGTAVKGTPSLTIHLHGLGAFPTLRSPRVVWVGVREETGGLTALQDRIEIEMERLGFLREKRGFRPHLTLGRFKSFRGREEIVPLLEQWNDREVGAFAPRELVLFRSTLLPSGAEYSRLKSIALAPSPLSSPPIGERKT